MCAANRRVSILDTTLRDGEQSPGIALTADEKLELAQQLARLNVDVIEAGFPITSKGDFAGVQMIAREVEGPIISALARAVKADIDTAWKALHDAARPRINVFSSSSDLHIERQLQTTRADVRAQIRAGVAQARQYVEDVEFSMMDATRADPEYLADLIEVAAEEGASTFTVADTVGYAIPDEFAGLVRRLHELVPDLKDYIFSVHCHNDLGLAVANSFAGLCAGAEQVHCTINGIGERAGNAALEEIVMLLHTRQDVVDLETQIDTMELIDTSRLVEKLTGYPVQPNKALVGRNAFAHESGLHQDGLLKDRTTYEIVDPRTVGLDESTIVLGKHSGRHAMRHVLSGMGVEIEGQSLTRLLARFKEQAEEQEATTEVDLKRLVGEVELDRAKSVTKQAS